jgi:hypothetical membrane protein
VTAINADKRARAAAVAWFVAAVGYLVAEKVAAVYLDGPYSYLHQYISVLGVPAWGRFAWLMNGAFYVEGALLFVGALLVTRAVGRRGVVFLILAAAAGIGFALVATVHGGSPLAAGEGGRWHMVGALMAFIAGNAAIAAGSGIVARAVDAKWWYRGISLLICAAGFAAFLMLANYNVITHRYAPVGLVERIPVYTILGWQLFSALVLWLRPARRDV